MATGSQNLTTYYAKRIIGDAAASTSAAALIQTGAGITASQWILGNSKRSTAKYGIYYVYDSSTNGTADKLELYGDTSSHTTATAWVRLDTGDLYIYGKVGINYNPNTSGNTYQLYVSGTSYFNGNTTHNGIDYFANGTTYYINNSAEGYLLNLGLGGTNTTYKLYVNGTSYFNGNTTHNGIDYFANGTTYYINNSADAYLRDVKVRILGIDNTGGASGYGISLYNGTGYVTNYGILFGVTSTYGTHGNVTGDWATYFTMDGGTNRGWIFRHADGTRRASISCNGILSLGHQDRQNNSMMKCDTNDRPGIGIFGHYPQILIMSSAINNTLHGATLTFSAYDTANATSGAFKSWTFGIPGTNATHIDLGYGASQNNPHYNGMSDYGSACMIRVDNEGTTSHNGRISVANRTTDPGATPNYASIEIREAARGGTNITYSAQNAPRIGFHWGSRWWLNLAYYEAELRLYNADFSGWASMRVGEHYVQGWVRFDNWTGIYSPNNTAHFYPNNSSTYGTWTINGSRNGYYGINLAPGATMTVMCDSAGNGGLFHEGSNWALYYAKGSSQLGLRGADVSSGYSVQVNGSLYVTSNINISSPSYIRGANYCDLELYGTNGNLWRIRADQGESVLRFMENASTRGRVLSSGGFAANSSRLIKNTIISLNDMGTIIDKLEPCSFYLNDDRTHHLKFGLIYEDTLPILPEICYGTGPNPEDKSICYTDLVPVLLKEIQSLRKRVHDLENK